MNTTIFKEWLKSLPVTAIHPVVSFNPKNQRLVKMDFTEANTGLTAEVIEDTGRFSVFVSGVLAENEAEFGIGGYAENRTVYSRSRVFDAESGTSPRRLHLGIDIWGKAGTAVFAPFNGMVHSFAFNNRLGDYGATIILEHSTPHLLFYSLYGHLSLRDIESLEEGQLIEAGQLFAHFGAPGENGHWPPHLHFQLILDMEGKKGDYPGVCSLPDKDHYLRNCPDPDLVLQLMQYAQ
ncbi:MAG TPA: peptidoglycan DD-metalloendopeptidase family protein [Sediminibacterium sp.]|nr:peptidoglycan DD-metalloendopeptidase family protein [Sediminibacterium sp.]